MSTIVLHFSKNTCKNNNLVKRFIEKHCPIRLLKYRNDKNKQRARNPSTTFNKQTPCHFFSTFLLSEQNKEMIYNNNNNKMSLVVIYNRNQRTATRRELAFLCRCFFTGDTITGGLRNHREELLGVSSLTLALNS